MTDGTSPPTRSAPGQAEVASNDGISSNIDNLTMAPRYRGCIDRYSDFSLSGWCFAASDTASPVELEISILGIIIGHTTTRHFRKDIARKLTLPCKPGFNFALTSSSLSSAAEACKALEQLKHNSLLLSSFLEVTIAEHRIQLPLSARLRRTEVPVSDIVTLFRRLIAAADSVNYIQLRDDFLSNSHIDVDLPRPRVIAFYLPQYHPFAENNEWWGDGFTEWTNVSAARPYFSGHEQPRLPADLGFYDLRVPSVQHKQVELARLYGVSAFCYYYYWFSGKTLMTLPIERHVEHDLHLDFCLCWANENWSRRWDGSDSDVLIAQRHSEDNDAEFLESCLHFFRSKRYVRIDGKPLLLVYRISLLANPTSTINRWREIALEHGFEGLHVCMVESFGLTNPYDFGCDSSCQFPPHGLNASDISHEVPSLAPGFKGKIYNYEDVVAAEIARPRSEHIQFRSAMPSWDNTSRKGTSGNVFRGSTPALFEAWLTHIAAEAMQAPDDGSQIVFINAWNEWAEGAHLEPDRRNGHAYLRAVRSALSDDSKIIHHLETEAAGGADAASANSTLELISKLKRSNYVFNRMLEMSRQRFGGGTAPFVLLGDLIDILPGDTAEQVHLESVNGQTHPKSHMLCLKRNNVLFLRGWIEHFSTPTPSTDLVMIALIATEKCELPGAVFGATVYTREHRPGLAASEDSGEPHWSGFSFSGALTGVARGAYTVSVLRGRGGEANQLISMPTKLTVIVG